METESAVSSNDERFTRLISGAGDVFKLISDFCKFQVRAHKKEGRLG